MKQRLTHKLIGGGIFLVMLSLFPWSALLAQTPLVIPNSNRVPQKPSFYVGHDNAPRISFYYGDFNAKDDIGSLIYRNGVWSTLILEDLQIPNDNPFDLVGAASLGNGVSLMVLAGDDTNYREVYGLPEGEITAEDLAASGITAEEIVRQRSANQRLFFSLLTNGKWSKPIPVPATFYLVEAQLVTGADRTVALVFRLDIDKDLDTVNDQELYISVYRNGAWANPLRLTRNDLVEYRVRAQYLNGSYLVSWMESQNAEVSPDEDTSVKYTTVGTDHTILAGTQFIPGTSNTAEFNLASLPGAVQIFWTPSLPENAEFTEKTTVQTASYTEAWSAAEETGLENFNLSNISTYEVNDDLVVLHESEDGLRSVTKTSEGWLDNGIVLGLQEGALELTNAAILRHEADYLWVAMLGAVPEDADSDDEAPTGIYFEKLSLLPDVVISRVEVETVKQLNTPFQIEVTVKNEGIAPVSEFQLQSIAGGEVVETFTGAGLSSGQEAVFTLEYTLTRPVGSLQLELLVGVPESDTENNTMPLPLSILPDFEMLSLTQQGETTLVATIEEKSEVGTVPVPVEFFLVGETELTSLGTASFDTNNPVPVLLDWADLPNQTGAFQVLAEINGSRALQESDHGNNTASYLVEPVLDVAITHFQVTPKTAYLTVSNVGQISVGSMDLILTDSGSVAILTEPNSETPPLFSQTVDFTTTDSVQIEVARADLPESTESVLFAVLDPYRTVADSDRLNNTQRTFMPPLDTSQGEESSVLEIKSVTTWCNTVQVQVINPGTLAVITPKVEMIHSTLDISTQATVPVITPAGQELVTFQELGAGDYQLRLSYQSINEVKTEETNVTINPPQLCRTGPSRNLAITEFLLTPQTDTGTGDAMTQLQVALTADGFGTNFLKPLIRVPVSVQVKTGTTILFEAEDVWFLPENGETPLSKALEIPTSALQAGAQMILQTPIRDDEQNGADNVVICKLESETQCL